MPIPIESAREMHSKRVVQKKENRVFDIKPEVKMTFNELTDWYLGLEKVKATASCWRTEISLKKFKFSNLGDIIVSQIKPSDLENYQAKRKAEGLADNTVDHEVGAASTMIFKAFDNDIVGGDTLKTFKVVKKAVETKLQRQGQNFNPRRV